MLRVMAGPRIKSEGMLVPATHVFLAAQLKQDVGARHKAGHDSE